MARFGDKVMAGDDLCGKHDNTIEEHTRLLFEHGKDIAVIKELITNINNVAVDTNKKIDKIINKQDIQNGRVSKIELTIATMKGFASGAAEGSKIMWVIVSAGAGVISAIGGLIIYIHNSGIIDLMKGVGK